VEYTDWIVRIIVLGLLAWALKGLIMERTKKIRASDQYLTLAEIEANCEKEQDKMRKEFCGKIDHAVSLIEKDLEHGQTKFKEISKEIKDVKIQIETMHLAIIKTIQANGAR